MGTVIIATLQRGKGGTSPFPVSIPDDRKDAHVIVNSLTDRNEIEEFRRIARMTCYVTEENTTYRLGTDVTISGQTWTDEGTAGSYQLLSEKAQPEGYCPLNAEGYVDPYYVRSVYVQDSYVVADEAERNALSARTGDICHQLDTNQVFVKLNNDDPPLDNSDWAEITSASEVTSVNGMTGEVSITITNLLNWSNNAAEFDDAVGATSTVNSNTSQINNNTANIQILYSLLGEIVDDPNAEIPIYDDGTQYEEGDQVLYDPGVGRFNFYRCKQSPIGVNTPPDNTEYWELIGDFYTRQEIEDFLAEKADLVEGKVPLSQLPTNELQKFYVVGDLAERDTLEVDVDTRAIVLDASGDSRLPNGGLTEYLYKPADPRADTEGWVWCSDDSDQAFDFDRIVTRIPKKGDTPGGVTINEGMENMFFGPVEPVINAEDLELAMVGTLSSATIQGTVTKEGADTIDRIDYVRVSDETILQSDVPASPQLDSQDLYFVCPTISIVPGENETYRVDVVWTKASEQSITRGEDLIYHGVYPTLYGNTDDGLADLWSLIKILTKEENIYQGMTGNKRMYFAVPDLYNEFVDIQDQHSDSQFGSLFASTPAIVSVTSTGLDSDWTQDYKLYESQYDVISDDERFAYLFEYEDEIDTSNPDSTINQQKLDSIEFGAEVNQPDSVIKFQYESNNDTNAYTDAEKSKLAGIEDSAEVNQDDATIKVQYENNADTNAYTDSDKNKLDGIDTNEIGDMLKSEFVVNVPIPSTVNRSIETVATGYNTSATTIPHGRYLKVSDVNLSTGTALVQLADNTNNDSVDAMADEDILPGESGRLGIIAYNPTIDTTGQAVGDPVYLGQNGVAVFEPPTVGSLIRVGIVYHVGNPGFIASLEFVNLLTQSFQADWRHDTFYPKGTLATVEASTEPELGKFTARATQDHVSPAVFEWPDANWELVDGDMKTELYDPNEVHDDGFNMTNMIDNAAHVRMTTDERDKLAGLEDGTFRGYYETPNALNAAEPVGEEGWSAIVLFENDEITVNGNLWTWVTSAWTDSGISAIGGNMNTAVYDPTNINADGFDLDNMYLGSDPDKIFYTTTEQSKLAGLEEGSNYYDKTEVNDALNLKADITYVDAQDVLKMDKTVYDPGLVSGDAFDMANMVESATEKILTDTERSDISQNTTDRHTHTNKALLDTITDAGTGELQLTDDGTYHEVAKAGIHNGTCIEQQDLEVYESGGLVYCDVEKNGGGDVQVYFGSVSYYLDCTTGAGQGGRARIELVPGATDEVKQNLIAIILNAGTPELIAAETTAGFPSEFAWVGYAAIRDAGNVAIEGAQALQRFTDAATHNDRGRLSYLGESIRIRGSRWSNGVDPSANIVTNAGSLDDVYFTNTSGNVYQLHRQSFPALDISADGIFITQVSGTGLLTNYDNVVNLNAVNEYSDGSLILDGDFFNLVIYGAINKATGDCKLYVNPSSGGYVSANAAYNDQASLSNNSAPVSLRTVAFLIARIPLKYTAADNGTFEFINPVGSPEIINLTGNDIQIRNQSGNGKSATPDAIDVNYDNTISTLAATNVQDAIDELKVEHTKIRGGLYYDGGGGSTLTVAGEVNPTTTLFTSADNTDSPAAGQLRATVAGDVLVTASLSVELIGNTTQARYQIAVNGTVVPGAFATAQRANSSTVSNPTISVPLTLAINDYVSIIMSGADVDLYDFTLTMKGEV